MEVSAGVPVASLCLDDHDFSDVELIVPTSSGKDARYPAHKVIVSRLSNYFGSAFTFNKNAAEHRLNLPSRAAEHLPAVLRYLYGASILLSPANCVEVLLLADYLLIAPLYSSALAFGSVAMRHDASALLTVLDSASQLGVGLMLDVATNAALTSCWGPLIESCRGMALATRGVATVSVSGAMGRTDSSAAAPAAAQAQTLSLPVAASLVYHQCLAILRALPPDTSSVTVDEDEGGVTRSLPPGAAGAAAVAAAVASEVAQAPAGPAARALASGGAAPQPRTSGSSGTSSRGAYADPSDSDFASRHWLRGHLSGLLRTSAAFPRPRPQASNAAGLSDAFWLASAAAETERLTRWQARRGVGAGDNSDDEEEADGTHGADRVSDAAPSRSAFRKGTFDGMHRSTGDVNKLRSEVSDLVWSMYQLHVVAAAQAGASQPSSGPTIIATRCRAFLTEFADVFALAAVAPVLKGELLWQTLRHVSGALLSDRLVNADLPAGAAGFSAADQRLVDPLTAALAVAFSSACVRKGISDTISALLAAVLTDSASVSAVSTMGRRPRPAAAPLTAAEAADEAASQEIVRSNNPSVRLLPFPRVPSSGSLGSDDAGDTATGTANGGNDAASAGSDDEEGAGNEGNEREDGAGNATIAAAGQGREISSRYALVSDGSSSFQTLASLCTSVMSSVLGRDELRVRSEGEVVGHVMDCIIGLWLATQPAGWAVEVARGSYSSSSNTSSGTVNEHLSLLRSVTASLWSCIRWEHASATACAAAITAVQLLCVQGLTSSTTDSAAERQGALPQTSINIGISPVHLRRAYERHRLGLVVTSPAAALSVGLLPPRLSYAGRPRSRLLGEPIALELEAADTNDDQLHAIVPWHSFPASLSAATRRDAAAAVLGDNDALPQPPRLNRVPALQRPLSAGSADALPADAIAAQRPLRIIFGSHAVQLLTYPSIPLLTDGEAPLAPMAAAAAGGASRANPVSSRADDGSASGASSGSLTGAAASAQLAGASHEAVTRLLKVHRRRRRHRLRTGTIDGHDEDDDEGNGQGQRHQLQAFDEDNEGAATASSGSSSGAAGNSHSRTHHLTLVPLDDATPLMLPMVALPLPASDALAPLGAPALAPMTSASAAASALNGVIAQQQQQSPLSAPVAASNSAVLALTDRLSVPTIVQGPVQRPQRINGTCCSSNSGIEPAGPAASSTGVAPEVAEVQARHQQTSAPSSISWPPRERDYDVIFGHGGHDPQQTTLASRLRDKAAAVREAYSDVFRHITIRRGWRSLPFTPDDVAPAFEAAAEVVVLIRHFVDSEWRPGFKIRQLDGNGQAFLWALGPPPHRHSSGQAGDTAQAASASGSPHAALRLQSWREAAFRGLVHATLQDGSGRYVDGLSPDRVEAALAAHPGP